jgi:hypothetical protein
MKKLKRKKSFTRLLSRAVGILKAHKFYLLPVRGFRLVEGVEGKDESRRFGFQVLYHLRVGLLGDGHVVEGYFHLAGGFMVLELDLRLFEPPDESCWARRIFSECSS